MKQVFTFFIAVLLTATVWAQSPEKMSYQAVIRNSSDALVTNTLIGMEINIHQGTPSGTVVYTETQTPTTNANGLVSIEIGGGTGFNAIDWANGPYFIETKTDPAGGTSYSITGTSQLLSVPYALHAKTAETVIGGITETDPIFGASVASGITGTDTAYWNNKQDQLIAGTNITIIGNTISATGGSSNDFYLGQDTLGGIVFYIYIGSDGLQHGLVVSKTESTATWSGSTLVGADRTEDGAYNMALMPTGAGTARTWVETLGAGWYLPSVDELSILWHNRFHANKGLNDAGATLLSNNASYWGSTEFNATYAFYFAFYYGYAYTSNKTSTYSVRAVRAF